MKKIITAIIVFITLFVITGCNVIKEYEDTNGLNNYDLQEISDEMILNSKVYNQVGCVTSSINHQFTYKANKLNGVVTIHKFRNGNCNIVIDFEVIKGNGKLVLCTKDEIIHIFNVNEKQQKYTISANEESYLRIAGESCQFSIKYKLEYTPNLPSTK